ncbi:MAG: hypothetical protein WHX52_20795 [Anaerolineae bacterium]
MLNANNHRSAQRLLLATGVIAGWGAAVTMTWDRSPVIFTPLGLLQNLILVAGSLGVFRDLLRESTKPKCPLWLSFSVGIAVGIQARVLSVGLATGLVTIALQAQHLAILVTTGSPGNLADPDANDRDACHKTIMVSLRRPEYEQLFVVADSLEMFSTNTLDHWWELLQLAGYPPDWRHEPTSEHTQLEERIHILPGLVLFLAELNIEGFSRLEIFLIGIILGLLLMAIIIIVVIIHIMKPQSSR